MQKTLSWFQGLENVLQGRELHPTLVIDESGIHELVKNGVWLAVFLPALVISENADIVQ